VRYAIPVNDGKLAQHFGHCEYFALIDTDEATGTIVRKDLVRSPGHEAEEGVSAVIAGGMGSRAQALFRENRIKVLVGAMGNDPEQLVLDYMRGKLVTGDNVCDH